MSQERRGGYCISLLQKFTLRVNDSRRESWLHYLDPKDLLPQILQVVKGGLGGDAVHKHEALPVLHVQVSHGRKLFLLYKKKQFKGQS